MAESRGIEPVCAGQRVSQVPTSLVVDELEARAGGAEGPNTRGITAGWDPSTWRAYLAVFLLCGGIRSSSFLGVSQCCFHWVGKVSYKGLRFRAD